MIRIEGANASRTFALDIGPNVPDAIHEANGTAFLRELQQRGLRPNGDVTVASIVEQEPDRYGQPRAVITYAVGLQPAEEA
ncbi:hypothetical protein ABZ345_34085 [Lentzea sp. NPDC005914]|uniref:hypothetical protein n=1 Tax=Lentzea sp. NPDC005914 TaxID=3154572 RepID=UPI0033EAECA3